MAVPARAGAPPQVARLALGANRATCAAGLLWGTGALVVNVLIARPIGGVRH